MSTKYIGVSKTSLIQSYFKFGLNTKWKFCLFKQNWKKHTKIIIILRKSKLRLINPHIKHILNYKFSNKAIERKIEIEINQSFV
jgi:hypothetical protein